MGIMEDKNSNSGEFGGRIRGEFGGGNSGDIHDKYCQEKR
jgi:hypothetical protein